MDEVAMAYAIFSTALGDCGIAWTERGVSGFVLPPVDAEGFRERDGEGGAALDKCRSGDGRTVWVDELIARVTRHLEGKAEDFADVRYDFSRVTAFQREVYEAALRVKAGETRTYGWPADQTGRGTVASRAVGGALGQNPWPLLVPCHRFIGANGKMTGFSAPGGLVTKRKLLAIEGAELIAEG
ncbi:cysteine methyltransferase [Nibricoccus aquaticus]|uniref:Cysteine methyltransferase n=1 Tax=Nibricoccus aquaticus TaxID=2576891 RepID=A0A290QCG9_9BACT|nr:methylated-DNA--[protein]-cysteine S-methyltransferase [Nibricoccus aquaticus]ATC63028.1 cysteine methyltransferase [Nibricoccus aquaticus]